VNWWAGIDIGSVSLKLVVIDDDGVLHERAYTRTEGRPIPVLVDVLSDAARRFQRFRGVVSTGSGRGLLAGVLGAVPKNEILTQAWGGLARTPDVRTIIEIGGQDSKLIFTSKNADTGRAEVLDHALNDVCAAGTGSFLDQEAARLGISIEEFGRLAMQSQRPCFVAGRCAVFAKSDMMHLQQGGAAREDMLAGLCLALARTFLSSVGKGRQLVEPINFQGGVAANPAVVRAFESVLHLDPGAIRVPEHFDVMGAYGAALYARETAFERPFPLRDLIARLKERLRAGQEFSLGPRLGEHELSALEPRARHGTGSSSFAESARGRERCQSLSAHGGTGIFCLRQKQPVSGLAAPATGTAKTDVLMGVDVGAASAKIVLIDRHGEVAASRYTLSQGDPIRTVRNMMTALGRDVGDRVRVRGVGVTGSGRYFIGALVGADVVVNEISSQAKAALRIDRQVDTLIEIGGQDSKYVRFDNGTVVDFEMNKVCAAGTGSFLQEQAARLGIRIEDDFEALAFASARPSDLGTRCTVFMESDLIHHQQNGRRKEDLVAGLAYAVVLNYMEKVLSTRQVGENVHFQGGVASNGAVVAALENVLGTGVTVSRHHRVTGALGAALYALDHWRRERAPTKFAGFDVARRTFEVSAFECHGCPNVCRISCMRLDAGEKVYFGGICDRYDTSERKARFADTPDLLEKREELMAACVAAEDEADAQKPAIGLPRALFYYDHFPLWYTFLRGLGFRVVLSSPTNRDLYYHGLRETQSESCHPVKVAYGHVLDLIDRGIDTIFFPNEIELPHEREDLPRSYNCPFMQGAPYMMRATFGDRARFVVPAVYMAGDRENLRDAMQQTAGDLGIPRKKARAAIEAAVAAQAQFREARLAAGRAVLSALDPRPFHLDQGSGSAEQRAVILLGKPHHLFDEGQNMHIAKKLRKLGVTAIPFDFLPLGEVELPSEFANVVWKNTHDLLRAAILARRLRLPTIMLTNFGCGPDSFGITYLHEILGDHPHLVIEIDDHSADAGVVTRLEAFLDTAREPAAGERLELISGLDTITERKTSKRNLFGPSRELLKVLEGRTMYFPYVCPGLSEILVASLSAAGLDAEVLPPQDARTKELGLKYAAGTECHPFIVTLGDFAKLTERPDFDPDRTAVAMFNYDGACRLSQYALGHKIALKRLGFERVPVIGPIISTRRDEFTGLFGLNCAQAAWKGWVAAEVLQKRLLATRPYETNPGEADRVYGAGIRRIAGALRRFSMKSYLRDDALVDALRTGVAEMSGVPVKRDGARPKIGILGEFFTVLNSWANADVIRQLEGLGAEVRTHGFSITNFLLLFAEHYHAREHRRKGRHLSAMYYDLRKHWLVRWADRLERSLGDGEGDFRLLHVGQIMRDIGDYVHFDIDPVSTTFVARVVDFARKGVAGINYLIVLNCMLSNMTLPIFRRIAADHHHMPILATPYDGFKQTNTRTRLEAFVEQARGIHERRST